MTGEAKTKRLSHKQILEVETRCIYCAKPPETIEHMPPLQIFKDRRRPNKFEFAACEECNHGTRGADTFASLLSRISPTDGSFLASKQGRDLIRTAKKDARDAYTEVFSMSGHNHLWSADQGHILTKKAVIKVNGPRAKSYLDVFCAKLGMAIYRQHTGTPLPSDGGVETVWHLNSGLTKEAFETYVKILPIMGTMNQGTFYVTEQFAYRYNSNGSDIVAALVGLNSNLHIFILATARPKFYGIPSKLVGHFRSSNFIRPGQLLMRLDGLDTIKHNLTVAATAADSLPL